MTDAALTDAAEPDGAPRIAVLDILRGVAILAILFMNINDMGQSMFASFDDVRHLGWSATDQVAWWLRQVLADGTARCLLEMLFGAGMVILIERAARTASAWTVLGRYAVRNLVLFAFGLVHVFILLWPGDILHTYGLAALVAMAFARLKPVWLLPIGLMLATLSSAGGSASYYFYATNEARLADVQARVAAGQAMSPKDRKAFAHQARRVKQRATEKAETSAEIAHEDAARRGTFGTWAAAQWHGFLLLESYGVEIVWVWEAASVMLIGAALFKLGILQGSRSRRFYAVSMVAGYAVGAPLRYYGGLAMIDPAPGPHLASAFLEVAREAMTLGHVGLINLLASTVTGGRLLRPFVAAGRTALSIYVAQTLICLWVLYPPFVLGQYGRMTWGPLMLTALVVNAALLVGANLWVRRFDIAPVEWAWRSLIAWRALPWRRPRPRVPAGAPLPA